MLRRALALALVASSVMLGAEPSEAISFDKPIRVINEKNEVRWISDGGTCLSPPAWAKVDNEFKRLQTAEQLHANEPSPGKWFLAGLAAGAVITAGVAIGVYAVTR